MDKIGISSRALTELLAGIIDIKEFVKRHNMSFPINNLFIRALMEGSLIQQIELEKRKDEDDDMVVIHFGSDAAIRPYVTKNTDQ